MSTPRSHPRSRTRTSILADIEAAKLRLAQLEQELLSLPDLAPPSPTRPARATPSPSDDAALDRGARWEWPLSLREYKRYGRQMLISPVGLPGQIKLKGSHVLVVGAGGLGCPVLLYLAAAGVGEITILDHDTVELSNLHRQVLHTEARAGMSKAESAKLALQALNSDVKINAYQLPFTPSLFFDPAAPSIFRRDPSTPPSPSTHERPFTLVLDCTDNPATRHFLNAYTVALRVPLVSGGAVRAEGTVGVYGLTIAPTNASAPPSTSKREEAEEPEGTERGPCYACLFPPAPTVVQDRMTLLTDLEADLDAQRRSLEGTGACADEGVLGVNCGIVGIGMAAEAVKVILEIAKPTLHLFAPLSPTPYRTIRTRPRKPTCVTCGTYPTATSPSTSNMPSVGGSSPGEAVSTPRTRWTAFLSSPEQTWPGWQDPLCDVPGVGDLALGGTARDDDRIKPDELKGMLRREGASRVRIIDTRPAPEFGIASVEGSANIPFARFLKDPSVALSPPVGGIDTLCTTRRADDSTPDTVVFLCRRGNDSLLAARALKRHVATERVGSARGVRIVDVAGGLTAWAKSEEGFPVY
ncbi:hypothetical protein JCM10212_001580 [Sporobolomyces blumeae]